MKDLINAVAEALRVLGRVLGGSQPELVPIPVRVPQVRGRRR